ncbi:MAG: glycosyltransferase family 1 protein [Candidatus Neomarinimicrobiota bacterium]|nr:MAG: glycosyltransferase family 1 protein [Candidatus Neomarinimicrobiota bacterium]
MIIPICEKIAREEPRVEFVLVENRPYAEVLEIKQSCDILVDQVFNRGGWGYGMNSVEAMALGLVCVTELVPEYDRFLGDHPFVNVTAATLEETLRQLVRDRDGLEQKKRRSRAWVEKTHGLAAVTDQLYQYYREVGWLD